MGYHLTIMRTSGAQHVPILRHEIMAALPALNGRLTPWPTAGSELQLVDPQAGEASALLVFDEAAGELWSSGPDDSFLARMLALAGQLGARVRGDEGETYRTAQETYRHPDDGPAAPAASARRRWSIWHWRGLFFGVWALGMAIMMVWKRLGGA
ncbi:hypothetical protein [Massilia sp. CF038]|uniref:hypothetical protein n=1 Tax=Massilia sp. CF038 TaxID=1881045 RepID=UPI000910D4D5|nr:hypothetical protein [Massilia sp. CF038]SHH51761.1 hypothetical protein SAMN05428948_4257 [Massilia sp. CF038]